VALLGSLAAHAAVALDTARLLVETQTALAELSAASTVIQAHAASVERAAAAHDRMTALVLRGGGVEDVAAAVTDILGGTLLVLDADGRTLAGEGELDSPALAEAVAAARGDGRSVRRGDRWVAAVVAGAENLGALVLRPDHPLVDADQQILERAALVTALLLLFRRTVAEAEGRVRGELLDDLIARPGRDPDALRSRARRLGVDLDAAHVLIAVGVVGAGEEAGGAARRDDGGGAWRQRAFSWATSYAASRGGLAAARHGRVVLLLPGGDAGAAARAVARDLCRVLGRPVTAGGAGPIGGPQQIPAAFRDAERGVTALVALGRVGEGASTAELGFVGLLLGEDRDVDGFVGRSIGPAVAYDARRGTALIKTLEAYFGAGGSLARAAEALHVHVNTVTQRLDRIGQLLGTDWQRPERALEVQLALRLHRLRAPLAG
jgi:DNA-binding PucR family transcriptional regulator